MNYQRIYDDLINKRQRLSPDGYVERHHVVPRSMGGSDASDNIVSLTAREHFIAHALLAKIHGGKQWAAFSLMRGKNEVSARTYDIVRRASSEAISRSRTGMKFSSSHKEKLRYKRSPEHLEKMSAARKGKKIGPHSAETRRKIGDAHRGKIVSDETRAKQAAAASKHKGRKLSDKARANIKASWARRKERDIILAAKIPAALVGRLADWLSSASHREAVITQPRV